MIQPVLTSVHPGLLQQEVAIELRALGNRPAHPRTPAAFLVLLQCVFTAHDWQTGVGSCAVWCWHVPFVGCPSESHSSCTLPRICSNGCERGGHHVVAR